ncbi:hypothetical protein QE385_003848 [Sphingomonas sp. SORGH_AS 950]|nr:hypothetical protein [Sphingomonas sp. SORGH_AS_0950]MDQ1159451.1 hypothetical protein [Sphingomonas sp. SORGH_AS_0950]
MRWTDHAHDPRIRRLHVGIFGKKESVIEKGPAVIAKPAFFLAS